MKRNCWEIRGCGREAGGADVSVHGICPAYTDERLDGVHGGKNAGRACWMVAGTFCGGELQGTFAEKEKNCLKCEVYRSIKEEERPRFMMSAELFRLLH